MGGGGGGGGGVGGLEQFSVSPRPLGFGFGAKGLGPGLDLVLIENVFSFHYQFKSRLFKTPKLIIGCLAGALNMKESRI